MRGYKFHAAQRGLPTTVAAAALLGASALAGCGGDDQAAGNGNNNGSSGPNACDNFFVINGVGSLPGAGNAASHGQPARIDSDILVDSPECTAAGKRNVHVSKIVQVSNDFGGASNGDVTFQTDTGLIDSCVANAGGYRILVMMEAGGPNETAARAALDRIKLTNTPDTLVNGKLTLSTKAVIDPPPNPAPQDEPCSPPGTGGQPGSPGFPGTSGGQPGTGGQSGTGHSFSTTEPRASIFVALPGTPSYVFKHTTQTGSIFASGFSGSEVDFTSDSGQLDLVGGHWDVSNLISDEGAVNVSGDHAAVTATTTNGPIKATLATVRSSNATVHAGLGDAEVILQPTGTPGFDLFASTGSGAATISVTGTDPQTVTPAPTPPADSKHSKSAGFDGSTVKVQVHASSQNGDVSIHE